MTNLYQNQRSQWTNDNGLRTPPLLVVLMFCVPSASRADDASYWKARAASALAIRAAVASAGEAKPSVVEGPVVAKGDARPLVTMYSAAWCAPCQRAKRELTAREKTLPFLIKLVDVDQQGWPANVDSIPHFEWDSPRGRLFAKWNGVQDLVARWELSQK